MLNELNGMFPQMWRVVPEGKIGRAEVHHYTVTEEASRFTALGGGRNYVSAGQYARLLVGGALVMSDTPYERRTNYDVVRRAKGRVLVAGYGLGMILTPIAKKKEVTEIVVVEREPDVLRLVHPHIQLYLGRAAKKIHVVEADIFEARPALGSQKFDIIYFDIWGDVSTDVLTEMAALSRRYCRLKAPDGWMAHWDRDWLQYRREQERRS